MPVRTQDASEARSKQSTLFVSDSTTGTWTELANDDSQHFGDASAGVGTMTMASPGSNRLNISHPRAITVQAEINSTDTGTFFTHGAGANTLSFDINTAGTLRAVQNNSSVGTLAIPGLTGTRTTYVCSWVSRANPLTTGLSDAVQSWLYILDVDGSTVARAEFFHAVKAGGAATATWGTFTGTITGIVHENRAQSLTEIARDWGVATPSAPSSECELELPPLPVDEDTGLGDENELYGPVPAWAAVHYRHARRRTWSPLANIVYAEQAELRSGIVNNSWFRLAPGSSTYYMGLQWMVPAPVPPGATHAFVRIHMRSFATSGSAIPIGIRLYSLDGMPDELGDGITPTQVGEVVTRDDSSSGGSWDVNAVVRLSVDSEGWTLLCPAIAFDPESASANDANARVAVRALQVVPCYSETAGGS